MTNQRSTPAGATKIVEKLSGAAVYIYADPRGRPCARAFAPKAIKPTWSYRFTTAANREQRVREFLAAQRARAEAKAERAAFKHGYKVGDLFRSSWGYDQTNVDWYEVVDVRGADLVLRKIAQDCGASDGWSGKCVPLPGQFVGKPFRKRAGPHGVRIASYAYAFYVAPEVISGVPVYAPTYWSAYA